MTLMGFFSSIGKDHFVQLSLRSTTSGGLNCGDTTVELYNQSLREERSREEAALPFNSTCRCCLTVGGPNHNKPVIETACE